MIEIEIPGYQDIEIKNIVFDFNGTIAEDGIIIDEIKDKINQLKKKDVNIYILTADTFGTVYKQCEHLPVKVQVIDDKKRFVEELGINHTVTIGNGQNDIEMMKKSVISIVVIGKEGCYAKTLFEADIVVNHIIDAINLLLKSNRMKATLRK